MLLEACLKQLRCQSCFKNFHTFSFSKQRTTIAKNYVLRNYLLTRKSAGILRPSNFKLYNRRKFTTYGNSVPSIQDKRIGYWLLTCNGMVFIAVILGGVTRLTESGLSMVTWKLLGEKMPKTETEWKEEFERYQQFPEFKQKNHDMNLEEFKKIWWMEYAHRMWGRLIGLCFVVPAAIFLARYRLSGKLKTRLGLIGSLIGAQGLMGWYMVKSGLENDFEDPNDVPRVSQRRLAAHLGLAFILHMLLLHTALDHLLPAQKLLTVHSEALRIKKLAKRCRRWAFVTAITGALVAGMDAGLTYNSFPKMGDHWVPYGMFKKFPVWLDILDNPTTAQFTHRWSAKITLGVTIYLWYRSRGMAMHLPLRTTLALNTVLLVSFVQVSLGIATLLLYVPVGVAALHQSGSLTFLSVTTWLIHELKHVRKIPI